MQARTVSRTTAGRGRYRLEALAADVVAVAEAVRPGGTVHLVGHDWGSVTGWEVVQAPVPAERVASFTSLSGPCLDHLGAMLRARARRPSPSRLAPVVAQGARSAYTVALSAPVLGRGMWRLGADRLLRRWLRVAEGIPADGGYPGPHLARAARAAVPVYRQNIWRKLRRPEPRPVAVPVQLLVAGADRYVSPRVFEDVEGWVPDLTRSELAAGHWSPRTHPAEVAERIAAFVEAVEARRAPGRAARPSLGAGRP